MRNTFVRVLTELMRKDPRVITITADMGYGVFEALRAEFPDRFINVGVAEANGVGVAAGLALSGYTVFFYAQATFATMRCFEQIRLDVASNNLDVKIIGTSAGFTLSQYGVSHFAMEDISLMRLLPNMTVFSPGDTYEADAVVRAAAKIKGPVYVRIGKSNSPLHEKKPAFVVGKPIVVRPGGKRAAVLMVTGSMLLNAIQAVELLDKKGFAVSLVSMPTLKPLDGKSILELVKRTSIIFTLEEHTIIGGLGSAIAEIIAGSGSPTRVTRLGFDDRFLHITGSREYLLSRYGLASEQIATTIIKEIKKKP